MLGYRTLCLWRGVIWGPFSSPSAAWGVHTGKGPWPYGDSLGTSGWREGDPLHLLEPTELPWWLALWVPGQHRHTAADEGKFLLSTGCEGCPCSWAV